MEKPPREHSAVHSLLCQQGRVFSLHFHKGKIKENSRHKEENVSI